MKIFVTGGNGFIGSVLVRAALKRGWQCRLLLREKSKTHRLSGLEYERCIGDVRDASSIDLSGCDALVHLASLSSWDDIHSPLMKEVVLDGTRNVLERAKALPRCKTVFVSSILAVAASDTPVVFDEGAAWTLNDPQLTYSHYKREAEKLCTEAAAAGQFVTIVNPGEVYGPDDDDLITAKNLIDFIKSYPVLVCNGGTLVAHVEDVALGILAALDKGRSGERYILGGQNLTIKELAAMTLDIVGKKKPTLVFPTGFIKALTKVATALKIPLPYNPNVVPYAVRYWFMSSQKAQRELGVSFRDARQTLEPTVGWLKSSGLI